MKEIKDSKIRIKKTENSKDIYNDTFSITRELEKTLKLKNSEIDSDKNKKKSAKIITTLVVTLSIISMISYLIYMNIPLKRNAYSSHYLISSKYVNIKEEQNV